MQVHPDSQVSPPICSIDVGDFPGPGNNCPDRAELSTQKISRNCLDSRGLGFFKALAVLGLQAFFLRDSGQTFSAESKALST